MVFQLENGLACVNRRWCVYEQNCIVDSVHVDDWTAELTIIASKDSARTILELSIICH